MLCILGSHTLVPRSCTCKNHTTVSHSSPKAKIISSDAGLRLEVVPALNLWDMVPDALEPLARRNPLPNTKAQKTKSVMADKRSNQTC